MTATLERLVKPIRPTGPRGDVPSSVRKYRPDIEGMRAFAVVSVVLYHAGIGPLTGGFVGVDVFFVISGFLITTQLLGSVGKGGLRSLPTFYSRRIKRLLPASITVVVATVIAARIWAPPLQVGSIARDGIYTTFYGLNYRLAWEGTQYLEGSATPSPLQHFWSLGVEEQFYVFWPVLIVLITYFGRRFRTAALLVVLGSLTAASFYFSVTVTKSNAPWAYFSLHTRAWEMGVGALVAVLAVQMSRLPRPIVEGGALLGLTALIVPAFWFTGATPFPGSAAAIPVLGAALLIACGCGRRARVERVLADPLLQCIGRVSYSWYLWHWPMLIIAPMVVGHSLNWPSRLFVVVLSLVTAMVSFFLIEDPSRRINRSTRQWFAAGALMSGTVVLVAILVLTHLPSAVGSGQAVAVVKVDAATPEAVKVMQAAIKAGLAVKDAPSNLAPEAAHAGNDLPKASHTDCHADYLVVQQPDCVFGDVNGTHTVVLFGDSHMEQWLPAFSEIGAKTQWRVINWTKSACPPARLTVKVPSLNRAYTECDQWRDMTLSRIAALKPDVVILSESENIATGEVSPKAFSDATTSTLKTLQSTTSAKLTFIEDIPVPNYSMPDCVASHLSSVTECVFDTKRAYTYPDRHAAIGPAVKKIGVDVVDPQDWFCSEGRCPAVVGNLLVYRDASHMTAQYSTWLGPMIASVITSPAGPPAPAAK